MKGKRGDDLSKRTKPEIICWCAKRSGSGSKKQCVCNNWCLLPTCMAAQIRMQTCGMYLIIVWIRSAQKAYLLSKMTSCNKQFIIMQISTKFLCELHNMVYLFVYQQEISKTMKRNQYCAKRTTDRMVIRKVLGNCQDNATVNFGRQKIATFHRRCFSDFVINCSVYIFYYKWGPV